MPFSEETAVRAVRGRRNILKVLTIALGALAGTGAPGPASARKNRCFMRGTSIRTVRGRRKVEDLAIGDLVPTVFGGSLAIKALRSHAFERHDRQAIWPLEARPVRVKRSALADNVPSADLYLTHSHGLFLDGVLIPAGNLVNGSTIVIDEAPAAKKLEYFHIEFEQHDVIEVEGAHCESLWNPGAQQLDAGNACRPCAPYLGFNGGRGEVLSRIRSAMTLFVDRRHRLDVIRDRIEERGLSFAAANTEAHVQATL
jgi:hypothetical protein